MKNAAVKTKKIHTTVKIFLLCFAVYFICYTYSK
jgi:hypothetical protein